MPALKEALMQEFPPFWLDPVNQCLWRRRETTDDECLLLPPKAAGDLAHAQAGMAQALVTMEDVEVPLAAWRVHATAAALYERTGKSGEADHYRALRGCFENPRDYLQRYLYENELC